MTSDFGNRTGLPLPRTVDQLAARIEDAAQTLRRVPGARNSQPAYDMRASWPDFVRDTREAYGYNIARGGSLKATAADIERMDEVLVWIARWWSAAEMQRAHIPEDAGAVAWLRIGAGWQMRRLQAWRQARWGFRKPPGGLSRESLRTLAQRAMEHMVAGLTSQVVVPAEIPADQVEVVWGVTVDLETERRVAAVLGDGAVRVQTRHARATWQEMPKRGGKEG
jgi:hypothetical protein